MKEQLIVRGGRKLGGDLHVSAAKNSVLPLIACCIMSDKEIHIRNCPAIADIFSMIEIIKSIGGEAELSDGVLTVNCKNANPKLVSAELTSSIRSSVFILGPILARFRYADISYPGGCEIGLRPIDLHIYGLKCLGIKVTESNGMIICDGTEKRGGVVNLDFPSVGATENIMMAGVLGKGITVIRNAAREPEIVDLQNFINYLGGKVTGAGSGVITVEGVGSLGGGEYVPLGDRIAASTYLAAVGAAGGSARITGVEPEHMQAVLEKLRRAGCRVDDLPDGAYIQSSGKLHAVHKIETQPFPGFPTDMQPQITAMLAAADGTSFIVENMFESRFKYTTQLVKMGAKIIVKDRVAVVKGVKRLGGAVVCAEDLRGGAALVTAALGAEGETVISGVRHIDRGYDRIENALAILGADISRVRI
ncbi:UDP-N-acetylglucosamine 1-carboxyvinyltransferase [Pumilibacter muris]|uniref:UDP-N-acetylglucosamine 1-carboxyvinyltransferase n=1 Tax=Pumilibacter muris TaxID=2941510 RepID=UPI00203E9929|nr:UDP-N-acetylglucosamine 1-carboxyvinyltransferase [Pumilibacter muris]